MFPPAMRPAVGCGSGSGRFPEMIAHLPGRPSRRTAADATFEAAKCGKPARVQGRHGVGPPGAIAMRVSRGVRIPANPITDSGVVEPGPEVVRGRSCASRAGTCSARASRPPAIRARATEKRKGAVSAPSGSASMVSMSTAKAATGRPAWIRCSATARAARISADEAAASPPARRPGRGSGQALREARRSARALRLLMAA